MKNLKELLAKVSEDKPTQEHILDFNTDRLLQFVPYEKVGYFLKPDVTSAEWEEYYRPLKRKNVIGVMEDYMPHAWDVCLKKALHSSTQIITYYHTWLWTIDDTKAIKFLLDNDNFACFGAPILKHICDKYKWELESMLEEWQLLHAYEFISGMGC